MPTRLELLAHHDSIRRRHARICTIAETANPKNQRRCISLGHRLVTKGYTLTLKYINYDVTPQP